MAVLLLTDRCLKRYRFLCDLHDLLYSLLWKSHNLADLLWKRLSAEFLKKISADSCYLVDGLNHMNRDTDSSRLVSDGSCDSLSDPPCSVCWEFVSLSVIELLNSLEKSKVTLLYKVKEQHSTANISLCNAYNKTKVWLCKFLLCGLITGLHSLCKFYLLLCA